MRNTRPVEIFKNDKKLTTLEYEKWKDYRDIRKDLIKKLNQGKHTKVVVDSTSFLIYKEEIK